VLFCRLKHGLLASCATVALAGCAINPMPWTDAQLSGLSATNFVNVTIGQERLDGAISLHEALARALKYNLDFRVEMMTTALRNSEAAYASSQMLPQLAGKAGYSGRDNYFITTGLDIPTGLPFTGTDFKNNTVSQEKIYNDADVTFSWNILDFALSYVRARQAADAYLIAQETKRKTIQHIIEDTRTAYWRAVSSERMSKKLAKIEQRVKRAIVNSRSTALSGAESQLTALTYERELIRIRQTAERLQHELNLARSQLAALMDIAPGTPFSLVNEDIGTWNVALGLSAEDMVAEAVFNRPEIREIAYQGRINEAEATAALLEILPGLKVHGANAFNSNSFLLENNWLNWGVSVADNLIKVVQLPAKRAAVEAKGAVIDQKALAMTMVVMTQVHVSRIRYRHFQEELQTAKEYLKAQSQLVVQLKAQAGADVIGEQTLIREEMNELVAEVQRDIAHGNVQNAAANLLVSMGLDVQARDIDLGTDVKSLASHLRHISADRVALSDRAKYLAELERAREEARRMAAEEERRRRDEAARVAAEAQRIKDEQARAVQAEASRVKDEAKRAKAEAAEKAKAETQRLKREAAAAREDAKKARRNAVSGKPAPQEAGSRAVEWRWPWEEPARQPGLKDAQPGRSKPGVYTGTK
jgi:outer membrane protein TolC